jgi:solute carrier family 25 protein 34/35
MQSQASAAIAVGHQHNMDNGMVGTLLHIFKKEGVTGLWRGVEGAVVRVSIGSGVQLGSFNILKEYCENNSVSTSTFKDDHVRSS